MSLKIKTKLVDDGATLVADVIAIVSLFGRYGASRITQYVALLGGQSHPASNLINQ